MGTPVSITLDEIRRHDPDVMLPPDEEFVDDYDRMVSAGREAAALRSVLFVAICRNAMPFLPMTLERIERLGTCFASHRTFIFENDSSDDTKQFLEDWRDGYFKSAETHVLDRPHLNWTISTTRTTALAEYRNACRLWAATRKHEQVDYVVVFDTDPWGGFSVDGVLSTIGYMERREYSNASGMASYSWAEFGPQACHYDAFAFRLNYWRRRADMNWFHLWHPVVGSPPIQVKSAFGQLAVYRAGDFVLGSYEGSDCEHVTFHRSLPGDFYLNPSMRCVSFWVPEGARMPADEQEATGLHGDVHDDVAGGNSNQDHRADS